MRIGSFFLSLLVALVALGYLLSDSLHLREDLSVKRKEIESLTQSLQRSQLEKQNILTTLHNTGQELQSCQQAVDQSNFVVNQITNENAYLKNQNQLLTSSLQFPTEKGSLAEPQAESIKVTNSKLYPLIILGTGSVIVIGLRNAGKLSFFRRGTNNTGHYIYLTNKEIKELVKCRRDVKRFSD